MSELSPLNKILKTHLNWHQARIDLAANFILALIRVGSVNLAEIATAFSGRSQVSSNYRRLQRFFKDFDLHSQLTNVRGNQNLPLAWLFDDLKIGQSRVLKKKRIV